MKRISLPLIIAFSLFTIKSNAQVGINTTVPTSTLDIIAKNATGATANVDGLLVPRVDRLRAQTMASVPVSTMIYVNNAVTGTQAGTTVNVDAEGYYYFNGTAWVKLHNPSNSTFSSVNIYNTDGSLTGNRIVTQAANTLAFTGTAANAFSVDGTTLSVDAANDRVGIGTTAPGVKLDVAQAIGTSEATQFRIINTSPVATNNTAYMGFNSYNGGGATWALGSIQNSATTTDNNFNILYSSGGLFGKVFTIRPNTGNAGIGTETPQKKLHVNGGLQITNELNVGGNASTAGSAGTTGQVLTSAGASAAPTWQTPAANLNIYNSDGSLTGNRIVTQAANTLAFTGTAVNAFSVDGTTLSVDAANDRVGIGTAAPENKFQVVSTTPTSNRYMLFDAPVSTNSLPILALRNTSPAATGNFSLLGFSNTGPTGGGATWGIGSIRTAGALEEFFIGNSTGSSYIERVRIASNGFVGIGTSAPTNTLHINGTNPLRLEGLQTASGKTGTLVVNSTGVVQSQTSSNISAVRASGTITITVNNTFTNIGTTAETFDNLNEFASNTFTASATGLYKVDFIGNFPQRANTEDNGDGYLSLLRVSLNGAQFGLTSNMKVPLPETSGGPSSISNTHSTVVKMNTGDTLTFDGLSFGSTPASTNIVASFALNIVRID